MAVLNKYIPVEIIDKFIPDRSNNNRIEMAEILAFLLLYPRVKNLKFETCCLYPNDAPTKMEPKIGYHHLYVWCGEINVNETLNAVKSKYKVIREIPNLDTFLWKTLKLDASVRIMPEENTAVIFIRKGTTSDIEKILSFFSKFYKVFDEKPLTKDEKSLMQAIIETPDKVVAKLNEAFKADWISKLVVSETMGSFVRKIYEKRAEKARKELKELEVKITQALDEYKRLCDSQLNAAALLRGYEEMKNDENEDDELRDYLLNNPRIVNVQLDSAGYLSFVVKTFFAPHHIDEYEQFRKRENYFDQFYVSGYTKEQIKTLMDAFLSENRCLKVKMCAFFHMNYFGSEVSSQTQYAFSKLGLSDYIPNTHLNKYNCFGSNRLAIIEQLKDGDLIGAIECATACAQRINISETFTFQDFIKDILRCKKRCFVTEDKIELTPNEALQYLEERNKHE